MRTQDIAYIALFGALTAVLGLIPTVYLAGGQVPISAQSLGPMLAGSVLGARRGAASQLLLLLIVASGLPILAGGRGGLGVFVGPTAGFLIAFPIAAFVIGLFAERLWQRLTFVKLLAINIVGGIIVVYAFGIPGWAFAAGKPVTDVAWLCAVFLPGDAIKVAIASAVGMFVKRGYPLI
ncbi:MAG: biotin transporter BioY [Alphaproteobacteria bacterium]|jgi:biotin transport system substrate-specific component